MDIESVTIFFTTSFAEELKTLRRHLKPKSTIPEEWDLEKLVMKQLDGTREARLAGFDDNNDDDFFLEDFLL